MTEYVLIQPDINLDKWNGAIDQMIASARRIEKLLGDLKVDVKVNVADSELATLQRQLTDQTIDIKPKVTDNDLKYIKKRLDQGDGTFKIDLQVDDQELKTAQNKIDSLDSTADVDVKVDDQDIKTIQGQLNDLKTLAQIDLVFTVGGKLAGGDFASLPVVGTLVELDATLAGIEGRTNAMIPDAQKLIIDLYNNGWGDSITQIGEVITQAKTLGITQDNLAKATEQAFQVAQITGYDTFEVLRSMDSLVKNNLAKDFDEAADILVTGFQTGNDRGGDLLDTFNEYGSTFAQLKIDGSDALGFINTGLEAGVDNSDRIADALRETGIRLSEMNTDENIKAAFKQLDELSDVDLQVKFNAYQSGEISGGEFFEAFFKALGDANKKDPTKAKNIAATLVGTIAEDFGVEAISKLSPQWDKAMGTLEGRSKKAGDKINDNLGQQLENLRRYLSTEFVTTLDETFDLSGLIDKAKTAIATFMSEIQTGATFGGALEVALQIPGLEHQIDLLSSAISNLLIGLLEVAANIGEFAGRDVSGLRDTIKDLTRGQLEFDLKTAQTVEEMTSALGTALSRGFTSGELDAILAGVVGDVLEEKGVGAAQAFIDTLKQIEGETTTFRGANPLVSFFASSGVQIQPGLDEPKTDAFQVIVDNYERETGRFTKAGDQAKKSLDDFAVSQGVVQESTRWWDTLDEQVNRPLIEMANQSTLSKDQVVKDFRAIQTGSGSFEVAKTNFNALATAILSQTGQMTSNLGNLANVLSLFSDAGSRALDVNASMTPPEGGGGGIKTADIEANARGGIFSGASLVGEDGPELITSNEKMAVLNNQTTENIWRALSGMGGGVTNNRTSNVTVNMIFNTASMAQAYGAGNRIADQVRGYAG